ncbi:MAG: hypothetical protein QM675_05445 [Protaetiibacter sp.]
MLASIRSTRPFRRIPPLLAAAALGALALAGCAIWPLPGTTSSPSASESELPMPCCTPTPTPDPTESTEPTGTAVSPDMAQNLADAVSSGNTAAIQGYLADPTRVVIAASEADSLNDPVDAVLSLDYIQPGVGVWDFGLDAEVIAGYAGNPYYGEFFPEAAIVGRSDANAVVSFVPDDSGTIGTIFMSIDEAFLTDY